MTTTIGVQEAITSFNDLRTKLSLNQTEDAHFFTEWSENLPAITEAEKTALDLSQTTLRLSSCRVTAPRRND